MIDEDVETYTNKLETLLLGFKTEAVRDFMQIKRHILNEQAETIGREKDRCDALLGTK
jgi:hypothetical protein